jgi:hypothetical protein
MKIGILLIVFLFKIFPLAAQPDKILLFNKTLVVTYENESIVFRDSADQRIVFSINHSLVSSSHNIKIGTYRADAKKFLYHLYHRGESGGEYTIDLYQKRNDTEAITLEASTSANGFGGFEITDEAKYGSQLVTKRCEAFYGKFGLIDPLFVSGFGEIIFPVYYILDKDSQNRYYFRDVTFDAIHRPALSRYFVAAEDYFVKHKSFTEIYPNNLTVAGLMQYYAYKSELGERKDALRKIWKSDIQLVYFDGVDTEIHTSLYDFIKSHKFRKYLSEWRKDL